MSTVVVATTGKGKKRSKETNSAAKDFGVEYSKSARATCVGCQIKIAKDDVRIKKVVFDTEVGMKYGGQPLWHHVECFAQLRNDYSWFAGGDVLPGFASLSKDDQAMVKKAITPIKSKDVPDAKKPKLEKKDKSELEEDNKTSELIKTQMARIFKFRDAVKSEMSKTHMYILLEENNQTPIEGESEKLLDQVADLLTFGALLPCPKCQGQFRFNDSGFICTGSVSEWATCANMVKEPPRMPCGISKEMKKMFSFLKGVKKTAETRAIRYLAPSASVIAKSVKKEEQLEGPRVKRERPPLYNCQFAFIGLKDPKDELKERITKLGGKVVSAISEKTFAIFSTSKDVEKMSSRMDQAKDLGIHILPIDYLDAVEEDKSGAISFITSKSLCDWGTDPSLRIPQEETKSGKSKSIYTKSVPKSMTLKLKGGLVVDPDALLDDVHVYVKGKDKFTSVLGLTDIQKGKNSYYKLQVLEADTRNRYWVFRSWGRIGTTIGGTKLEDCSGVIQAVNRFKEIYLEQTGNEFDNREHFVKRPGRKYPIDIDYGDDVAKVDLSAEHAVKSKLEKPVQDLIKLLFDVDAMKKTMLEFDLDMEKMPLGKLSQKQIQSAYKVLTEINSLIEHGGENTQFIDCTNRFYTLIPHSFGVDNPPLLDTVDQVKNLSNMLDSLMEIECAYSMLKTEDSSDSATNPIDSHYDQLKTELRPLDKKSEEFKLLRQYVQNTHAETHKMFELEILDVFKVARQGEARRYKPFKKLHNRKLLWHGSRLTNYAGILSHGLKIAPPEAPVTGYMFGKGIYFADMVSKSANYCFTSKQNNVGLMLLSEVALGDMLECTQAKYVEKLPKDKHSTFGKGRTQPNPKESHKRADNVEIPLGKPVVHDKLHTSLLYNEFIVYDVAQVNVQYLLKMDFKYKY